MTDDKEAPIEVSAKKKCGYPFRLVRYIVSAYMFTYFYNLLPLSPTTANVTDQKRKKTFVFGNYESFLYCVVLHLSTWSHVGANNAAENINGDMKNIDLPSLFNNSCGQNVFGVVANIVSTIEFQPYNCAYFGIIPMRKL